jgi:uncharacterized RDD family membrane protein YckC
MFCSTFMSNPEPNPYAASDAEILQDPTKRQFHNASATKRFFNYLLDKIFLAIVTIAIALAEVLVSGQGWEAILEDSPQGAGDQLQSFGQDLLVAFVFYLLFEHLTGRTPAKWITQTLVVKQAGGRPSFLQILGRSLARFIPLEALSVWLSADGRMLHDSLSGTATVDLNSPKVLTRYAPPMFPHRRPGPVRPAGAASAKASRPSSDAGEDVADSPTDSGE